MNAYELADFIETGGENIDRKELSMMIRQQADRITELSKNVDELEEELLKTPQIKELSDEEIIEIRDSCYVQSGIDEWEFDDVVFAREILKKGTR